MVQDTDFIKYPSIPHLTEVPEILESDRLQVFEKLDGGNSQIRVLNGQILTGSRANFLTREEYFRFNWFKDFNNWAKSNYTLYNLSEDFVVYGEFMSPHTINYKPEFTNKFFLIDLYKISEDRFIPYSSSREILNDSGIEKILFLEPLAEGKLEIGDVKKLALWESKYSNYGREGVVVKDYDNQKFAKLWRTSLKSSKKDLMDEISKTMLSLRGSGELTSSNKTEEIPEDLTLNVYEELLRSGRMNISLAEISDSIKKVMKKYDQ
ncbi:MAG: RNA ligase family protein [Candidatus Pacearchaeota archaeon]